MLIVIWAFSSWNLLAGGGSCLDINGSCLTRVVVAEGWDGCGKFLKQDSSEVCHIGWHFLSWPISLRHAILFHSILPKEPLSKLEVILWNPATSLSIKCLVFSKSFVVWKFNSLHSVFPGSRFHLKKPLSLLTHKKQLLICLSFIMRLQQFSLIFRLQFFRVGQKVGVQLFYGNQYNN